MNQRWLCALLLPATGWALMLCTDARAQEPDPSKVEMKTIPIAGGVHMLVGDGGNLGVSSGNDGVFLVDDQYAPLTEKIRAAIAKLSNKPIRFVINTHWHWDHTGGNENLGKTGSLLVAHENVRKRMSVEQFVAAFNERVPASPAVALPVVTFTDTVTFHWNDEEIRVFHVAPAHTDGDSAVHFRKANVLHTGDLYFNGLYPFIDIDSGGSIDGMIAAVDLLLSAGNPQTRIIPGHGPLSSPAELRVYREMLAGVRDALGMLIRQGKSRQEAVAARPTAPWDAAWGNGFLKPEEFAGIIYDDLARRK